MTDEQPSPISAAELEQIRDQIPAVRERAYLNAGTLGPLPQVAIDAMLHETRYDTIDRQGGRHWERLVELQVAAREAMTRLTGVRAEQVALMHSTHEGLNACLWGMRLAAGDVIVTTDEEHPGLLVPLRHLQARVGTETRIAPWVDGDDAFVASILQQVDASTRAVAISHVSWKTGRVAPLRALRAALPDAVRLIVDGAQSGGVLDVDPADGWDAYTISGQKWPCGPNGSGGVALADPEAWEPVYGAYMQVTDHEDILGSDVVPDGRRLEMSQEALQPLAGFAASVDWLTTQVGLWRVQSHARALNARARARLLDAGVDEAALHGHLHLLGVDVPAGEAMALSDSLFEAGFLIRWLGDARLRFSFGAWNTASEVDGAIDALCERLAATRA